MNAFFPGGKQIGSVLAFPYGWQQPAKTEEWAYEYCIRALGDNTHLQMLSFPWATLIDLQRKGKQNEAQKYIEALHWAPPKKTLIRATVMQHIYAKDLWPILSQLGITDVFWSHANKKNTIIDEIRLHPFPLYPACCAQQQELGEWVPLDERRYLYSFIGAYEKDLYLSFARNWIFAFPKRTDAIVKRRVQWHFEDVVYGEQINGVVRTQEMRHAEVEKMDEYREVIQHSIFSLCPSGSGPNTIRLWESVCLGAIPVIISDNIRLPGDEQAWRKAAIFVPENQNKVRDIPNLLENLSNSGEIPGRIAELKSIAKKYSLHVPGDDIENFFSGGWKELMGVSKRK